MAVLTLDVGGDQAMARITHRLFLHSRCEGMLGAFFIAIGQRKHGERYKMEWSQVVGSAGRCRVGVREYTNSQGEARKINQIERFLEPAGARRSTQRYLETGEILMGVMELRPYQEEARQAVQQGGTRAAGARCWYCLPEAERPLSFPKVIEDQVRRAGRRVLILATGSCFTQAADKLRQATGLGCAVEKAETCLAVGSG